MDDVVTALIMAFSVLVFVFALSISMFMFSQVTTTAESLALYSDRTRFYDNVKVDEELTGDDYTERIVNTDTIIPTLYRYYKENFCVKIYDDENNLIQIFDVNLESRVNNAIADTLASPTPTVTGPERYVHIANDALKRVYNVPSNDVTEKGYYLFGAPWLGSTESVKKRVDFFINGKAGYINNIYVDYIDNYFYNARLTGTQFRERFISYSFSGQTMETDDGDTLVTGANEKDKIVIIYRAI